MTEKKTVAYTEPTADAERSREYRHSGHTASMETIILGIPEEVRLLDDKKRAAGIIEGHLEEYFYTVRTPAAKDLDLFLPPQFTPEEILNAADGILNGDKSLALTDAGKFLTNHQGILILSISDVYYYRPANSWAVQCWLIDTDQLKNHGIDFYIRNDMTDDADPVFAYDNDSDEIEYDFDRVCEKPSFYGRSCNLKEEISDDVYVGPESEDYYYFADSDFPAPFGESLADVDPVSHPLTDDEYKENFLDKLMHQIGEEKRRTKVV